MSSVVMGLLCAIAGASLASAIASRLEIARWRKLRKVVEDHHAYRPDDLVGRPEGDAFERASAYWSTMVGRMVDDIGPSGARHHVIGGRTRS